MILMLSPCLGFPGLERTLKPQSEIPYETFQQSTFKRAYMINHYSCCTYINNQTKCFETEQILQTFSCNLVIFDKNEGDFREKNYGSLAHLCGYPILILFIVNWTKS